jgi:hypothetical protein
MNERMIRIRPRKIFKNRSPMASPKVEVKDHSSSLKVIDKIIPIIIKKHPRMRFKKTPVIGLKDSAVNNERTPVMRRRSGSILSAVENRCSETI